MVKFFGARDKAESKLDKVKQDWNNRAQEKEDIRRAMAQQSAGTFPSTQPLSIGPVSPVFDNADVKMDKLQKTVDSIELELMKKSDEKEDSRNLQQDTVDLLSAMMNELKGIREALEANNLQNTQHQHGGWTGTISPTATIPSTGVATAKTFSFDSDVFKVKEGGK